MSKRKQEPIDLVALAMSTTEPTLRNAQIPHYVTPSDFEAASEETLKQ